MGYLLQHATVFLTVIPVVCDEYLCEDPPTYDSDEKLLDKMQYNVFAMTFKVEHFRNKGNASSLGSCKL